MHACSTIALSVPLISAPPDMRERRGKLDSRGEYERAMTSPLNQKGGTLFRRAAELNAVSVSILDTPPRA